VASIPRTAAGGAPVDLVVVEGSSLGDLLVELLQQQLEGRSISGLADAGGRVVMKVRPGFEDSVGVSGKRAGRGTCGG
jgi:hypothetical protein